jgi:hypothetical protein
MAWFWMGCAVGGCLGFLAFALCAMAGRGDALGSGLMGSSQKEEEERVPTSPA